jgi:hypothetical protein
VAALGGSVKVGSRMNKMGHVRDVNPDLIISVVKLAAVHGVIQVDRDVRVDGEHDEVSQVSAPVAAGGYGRLSGLRRILELARFEREHVTGVGERQG